MVKSKKHNGIRVTGIIFLIIFIALVLLAFVDMSTFTWCEGVQCAGAGWVFMLCLPVAPVFLVLSVVFLTNANGTKTERGAKIFYVCMAVLFGTLGLHDFLIGRKKWGFLHLLLLAVGGIVIPVVAGIVVRYAYNNTTTGQTELSRIYVQGILLLGNWLWALVELKYTNEAPIYLCRGYSGAGKRIFASRSIRGETRRKKKEYTDDML